MYVIYEYNCLFIYTDISTHMYIYIHTYIYVYIKLYYIIFVFVFEYIVYLYFISVCLPLYVYESWPLSTSDVLEFRRQPEQACVTAAMYTRSSEHELPP